MAVEHQRAAAAAPARDADDRGRPGAGLDDVHVEAGSASHAAAKSAISASPAPPGTSVGLTESIATSPATSRSTASTRNRSYESSDPSPAWLPRSPRPTRSGAQELTPERYEVLREGGTERAVHRRVAGTPRRRRLSLRRRAATSCSTPTTKFESGTGWPSFTEPKVRRGGRAARGQLALHAPHRGRLQALRRAPRPRIRRRARAKRAGCATASTPARSTSSAADGPGRGRLCVAPTVSRWRSSARAGWSGPSGRAAPRGACSTAPTSRSRPARSWPCSGARARASRRCCTCSAGSTARRPARSRSAASASPAPASGGFARCGAGTSASSSSSSTCCPS